MINSNYFNLFIRLHFSLYFNVFITWHFSLCVTANQAQILEQLKKKKQEGIFICSERCSQIRWAWQLEAQPSNFHLISSCSLPSPIFLTTLLIGFPCRSDKRPSSSDIGRDGPWNHLFTWNDLHTKAKSSQVNAEAVNWTKSTNAYCYHFWLW